MVTDSIDVLCLNVCGLKSILLYSDFRDLIASKDILIFLESKSDEFDVFDVPSGYCLLFSTYRLVDDCLTFVFYVSLGR